MDILKNKLSRRHYRMFNYNINKIIIKKLEDLDLCKSIENTNTYYIFKCGKVFSFKSIRFLKLYNHGGKRGDNCIYKRVDMEYGDKTQKYLVHRLLAEAWIKNPNPSIYNVIDHIDTDTTNNNLNNLRWVDVGINGRNRTKRDIQGVNKRDNRYLVTWRENDKQKSKSFNILKYGKEKAYELARAYRQQKIQKHYINN